MNSESVRTYSTLYNGNCRIQQHMLSIWNSKTQIDEHRGSDFPPGRVWIYDLQQSIAHRCFQNLDPSMVNETVWFTKWYNHNIYTYLQSISVGSIWAVLKDQLAIRLVGSANQLRILIQALTEIRRLESQRYTEPKKGD